MRKAALSLRNVTCRFGGVTAVESLTLDVAVGDRIAIIGPSGAGKSTLIGLLNGSISPTEGSIAVLGQPMHMLKGRYRRRLQRRVGTVYQQHQLIDNLSVIHNVNAGNLGRWPLWKAMWSLLWPQEVGTARQALAQLGLEDKLYARTDRLSGGQQQRVALARVLVQDPAVVLADEPVASVDPARAQEVMRLLCQVAERKSETQMASAKTLLVSLHTVELAKQYCDRIIGLRQGHLVFDTPTALIKDEQLAALYDLNSNI